jgi:outer membrane protein insertion porin family
LRTWRRCLLWLGGSTVVSLALCLTAGVAWGAPAPRTWGQPTESDELPVPEDKPPARAPSSVVPGPEDGSEEQATAGLAAPELSRAPGRVGLKYQLDGVEIIGNTSTLARVIMRNVPFRQGDTLDVDDRELELTRFRLLGTGYFRDVQLSLRRGARRGRVVLVVMVVERNTIVVNDLWLGVSADADTSGRARPLTAYGGLDVSETNLAGTGIALGGAMAIADGQLGLRTRFSDPQILKSEWGMEAQVLYNNARDFFGNRDVLVDDPVEKTQQDFAVVRYRRFGGLVGAGHDLGSASTRGFLDYRLERLDASLPRAASHRRGGDIEPIDFFVLPGASVLSTMRGTIVHDTRDEPVLATRGWHVTLLTEASLTPLGSDYPYAKLVGRASKWTPLPWGHVLRIEGIAGAIFGEAPLFEKFFVGDYSDLLPDRVLDLNFDRRPAPNFLRTAIAEVRYGDYALRGMAEYRIPLYRGRRTTYGIDFFMQAGAFVLADQVDITRPARGYSGFSRVPADLTFNMGLRLDTALGGIAFGVSNLIGFVPLRGEAR